MNRKWLAVIACIVVGTMSSANAYDAKHVNAKAVSVQWRFTKWFYDGSQGPCCEGNENQEQDGDIQVFTIRDAKTTNTSTIYHKEQGLAQSAVFDLTGTKIAFYRKGTGPQGPNGAGNCVTVNDGKNHVSIINCDGTGLRDLCDLPGRPGIEQNLDWAAGDWIYYILPKSPAEAQAAGGSANTNSVTIWKVNAKTGQNVMVAQPAAPCSYWRRFSINVDATRSGGQTYPYPGCSGGTLNSNTVYNFPPPNSDFPAAAICGNPGCNACVSTSGTLCAWYMGGAHENLFITKVAPCGQRVEAGKEYYSLDNDLEVWAGVGDFGKAAENPNWSVNSEKWILQEIGWVGVMSGIAQGSNQIAANWVDKVAIRVSNNPKPPCHQTPTGCVESEGICINNATGDIWIEDRVNNPLCNKYEDLSGVWHEVPGANTCSATAIENYAGLAARGNMPAPAATVSASAILVRVPPEGAWTLTIATPDGRTLRSLGGTSADAGIRVSNLGNGLYILTLHAQGKTLVQRCIVR
jgi:hypothetical protein